MPGADLLLPGQTVRELWVREGFRHGARHSRRLFLRSCSYGRDFSSLLLSDPSFQDCQPPYFSSNQRLVGPQCRASRLESAADNPGVQVMLLSLRGAGGKGSEGPDDPGRRLGKVVVSREGLGGYERGVGLWEKLSVHKNWWRRPRDATEGTTLSLYVLL